MARLPFLNINHNGDAPLCFISALATMIAIGINVIPDACSTSGFYFVLCLNCVLFCGKVQEIIFGNSLFFLTSIFQTSAMELTKRCLLIIPNFSVVQEKKISGQLVSQNDNKPISAVIQDFQAIIHHLLLYATLELKYYN